MFEIEVQRCTRRCHEEDRELRAGENFYSTLVLVDDEVTRVDYSEKAWKGPPEDVIGWWKSQMPEAAAKTVSWAPNDVMLHYFQQLESDPSKHDLRYVLTLLMIRRKIFRLESSAANQSDELMLVYCPRTESQYQVTIYHPTAERITEIQHELTQLLFANAS